MADLSREELKRLAQAGARTRVEELERELAAIRRAFPNLGKPGRGASSAGGGGRKRMSAAARKAVSERMTKYWAARRKAKAAKAKAKGE